VGSCWAESRADRIFVNGNIWTGDDAKPHAQALAVQGQNILAVGSNAEIRALAGPETSVIDLKGQFVVPGFEDSHLHFPGPPVDRVDLVGANSLEEFQHRIAEFARTHPTASFILGRGWGYAAFPDKKPDRRYIDAVVSDRPVYLTERDGHMGLGNSKAMQLAEIRKDTRNPPNGEIARNDDGEPTGELKESAQGLMYSKIPGTTTEVRYEALIKHMDEAASYGITAVTQAAWGEEEQQLFNRALAAGKLKIRFHMAPMILPGAGGAPKDHSLETPLTTADLEGYRQLRDTFRGPLIEFGSIKGVLDGTVDAKTAAMFEPYVGGGSGIPFWEQEDLNRTVALYDREGFQVMLHAIGDKAIHMALDAFEYAHRVNGTSGRRHRIEHAEVPLLSDLPRFKELGVIASTQPMFASPDATTLDNFAVVLGPERASHADSFRLVDEAGAVQAFGSDWPVFSDEVLPAIYCAVMRMTPQGTPSGGWYPQGRISVEAALRHFTRDGAYANFDEEIRGTLTAGKLADFVVLSQDILTIPPAQILNTKVQLTVMGGMDTYRAPEIR
jgi:predicted amidohydrolase YtcJ